ncbi:Toxin secretion protein (plasmid) [Vibrio harveyi]|uniref:HlyD family efflux transporter periplasmic adaptor subunit n=1 Tax=Vibrio harveyi TaxID=669 RepID=UPI001EFEB65C|nr:HlyD family efflux transporter periplasmic adaptor subunit [Vibrio harveyi]MCG9237381.1 HlyD family secretion protein [Vibrio harveyi]MCG9589989.1 HlyD family secretion protein [Vibrio harveyi]CAH1237625.1 Toxin secretion protein [Vibrio harveyi]CAH1586659.1 Toxin secretion protein [Vibrio harveyi]CAH1592449.1 Toxin secretion protein [Vibrio harveyi]
MIFSYMSLFRKEAISHQSERLTGAITLAQPLSIKLTVAILVIIAIAIVTFLFSAEYSRKETVRGFLMPNKGVIKSFATQGGTIERLLVKEGDVVEKDQALATMIIHQNSADGLSLSSKLQKQLMSQLSLLNEEISQYQAIQIRENQNLENKASALKSEQVALESQLTLANEKLELLLSRQRDVDQLNNSGFISKFEKENQKQALLEAKQEKQNIARLLLQQNNQISQTAFDKANLPQQYKLRINNLLREKADIENKLAQVQNNHSYTITASHAGTITAIQVVEGETLSPSKAQSKPLLHILPKGSELVAELLLPTRSAGFITKGQTSRLRFDAFPYQRFGFIESEITRIDRALIAPNEVQLPIALQEPVYRLRAKLTKQQVQAYGQNFELKSGMLFEADIMLEQRTLIEWLLEPLYSLKGRIS